MRAIDTNVLVRLLTRDDLRQAAAAEAFIARGAWVSTLALAETIWVLASVYEREAPEIYIAIDMLLNHESISLQDPEVITAALDLFRKKPSLGFSDCLMVQLARKAGHVPLGTFDRASGKVEGAETIS